MTHECSYLKFARSRIAELPMFIVVCHQVIPVCLCVRLWQSPAWKLPIELPKLPPIGASVPDKARFIQEAITMLMIFLDEVNPEGDDYIRQVCV